MKKILLLITMFIQFFEPNFVGAQSNQDLSNLAKEAEKSLEKRIAYIQTLAIERDYVYHYTLDGKEK